MYAVGVILRKTRGLVMLSIKEKHLKCMYMTSTFALFYKLLKTLNNVIVKFNKIEKKSLILVLKEMPIIHLNAYYWFENS